MDNELRDTLGLPDCLMCENKDYGWYEVMRDNCGAEPNEILNTLCDIHQEDFIEQIKNEMKETKQTKFTDKPI